MFLVESEAGGCQVRINRSAVFSIDPKHPAIAQQLISAFEKTETYAEKGLKYDLRLNFNFSVLNWLIDFVEENITGYRHWNGQAFATLSVTNGSREISWCGECSLPRFYAIRCIWVLPFWVPCCCIEKTYRMCVYHTHREVIICDITTV